MSVSTQRDTERALLRKERRELKEDPEAELDELTALYEAKGLSSATARSAAEELTEHDAFAAHAEVELGIDPEDLTNPWTAAVSSAVSFTVGALLPLLAILLPPIGLRIPVTVVAVLASLTITGAVSARLGGAAVSAPSCAMSSAADWHLRSPTRSVTWSAASSGKAAKTFRRSSC